MATRIAERLKRPQVLWLALKGIGRGDGFLAKTPSPVCKNATMKTFNTNNRVLLLIRNDLSPFFR